eukprot:15442755-Alexandrium_andersonii.AAC.1
MISPNAASPRSPAVATSSSTKASTDRTRSLLSPIATSPGGAASLALPATTVASAGPEGASTP